MLADIVSKRDIEFSYLFFIFKLWCKTDSRYSQIALCNQTVQIYFRHILLATRVVLVEKKSCSQIKP